MHGKIGGVDVRGWIRDSFVFFLLSSFYLLHQVKGGGSNQSITKGLQLCQQQQPTSCWCQEGTRQNPTAGLFRAGFYLVLTALTGPPCHSRGLSIAHFLDSRNNQNWRLGARCQRSGPAAHVRSAVPRGALPLHGQQSCSDTLEPGTEFALGVDGK